MKKGLSEVLRSGLAIGLISLISVSGCGRPTDESQVLQIKGSDTMVNLTQALAESFMKQNPESSIAVTGGGSGTGIAALISGTCQLAASSREVKEKEVTLARRQGADPQETIVALDGLVVVVNLKNPIRQLTLEQLAGIYTREIKNWRKLGGPDAEIVLLSREVNSGTHVYFKEHVLGKTTDGDQREFAPQALLLPSSQAIADEVSGNVAAIGYYGMGYLNDGNAAVAVGLSAEGPFIEPTDDNVRSGAYPISRPLFLYTRKKPEGLSAQFMDFVMSRKGQQIVRAVDFVPVLE